MLSNETLELIRFEVNGGEVPFISDWKTVLNELKLHAVLPLLGLRKKELMPPDPYTDVVRSSIAQQVSRFAIVASEQQKIIDELKKHDTYPVVIKGMSASQYYPIPMLRTVGDIDLLAEEENCFNKTVDAVMAMGYFPMREYEGLSYRDSLSCDSRHFEFQKGNMEIEVHSRYVGKGSVIEDYLEHAPIVMTEIDRWIFPSFSHLENGLVLLQHVRFHLTYDGVGLRLILDWLFYVKNILTDEYWIDTFSAAAEKCNLRNLAICLTRIGEIYFEMPRRTFADSADDQICKDFMELISGFGNFGRGMSTVSRKSKVLSNPFKAIKRIQAKGVREWKPCKKCKLLIPFAWCYALVVSFKEVKHQKNCIGSIAEGLSLEKKIDNLLGRLNMK